MHSRCRCQQQVSAKIKSVGIQLPESTLSVLSCSAHRQWKYSLLSKYKLYLETIRVFLDAYFFYKTVCTVCYTLWRFHFLLVFAFMWCEFADQSSPNFNFAIQRNAKFLRTGLRTGLRHSHAYELKSMEQKGNCDRSFRMRSDRSQTHCIALQQSSGNTKRKFTYVYILRIIISFLIF